MERAYGEGDETIELKPGETLTWRLPPCTAGAIDIEAKHSIAAEPTAPPGAPTTPVRLPRTIRTFP